MSDPPPLAATVAPAPNLSANLSVVVITRDAGAQLAECL